MIHKLLATHEMRAVDRQRRADRRLLSAFRSLGDDCEFGMVQTHFEATQPSLCKFASTPLRGLVQMLETRFAAFMDPALAIRIDDVGIEYASEVAAFGTRHHTHVRIPSDETQLVPRERKRLALLARLLIEELESGEKIFVVKSATHLVRQDVERLRDCVRTYGPGTLLWVVKAMPGKAPGRVEWLDTGLMQGHIANFAPRLDPFEADVAAWRGLCRAAVRLQYAATVKFRVPAMLRSITRLRPQSEVAG